MCAVVEVCTECSGDAEKSIPSHLAKEVQLGDLMRFLEEVSQDLILEGQIGVNHRQGRRAHSR